MKNEETIYDKINLYISAAVKSVAIGWLPSDIRPEVEEKVLSNLEKELLYKGEVFDNYSYPGYYKEGTKLYNTGDISAIVNGFVLGTYIGAQQPSTIAGIFVATVIAGYSALARYIANSGNNSDRWVWIETKDGTCRSHIVVAGNLLTALPISFAVKAYRSIKNYLNEIKKDVNTLK